jgi:orotidine-5'-phosphate decarboxylase
MKNPIIVALDLDSAASARDLVRRLSPAVSFFKVGMELYAAAGMDLVRGLLSDGHQVFLDMKYYDIPETVKRATARVAEAGVTFLTVHSSLAVMRAAVEGKAGSPLRILGVTVLTSVDDNDLRDDGYSCDVPTLVDLRVVNARNAGVTGIVCSPLEVARVRTLAGPDMELVVPGVRSPGASAGDQKRVATPAEAIRGGADWLVIGREITRASDPRQAAQRILDTLSA